MDFEKKNITRFVQEVHNKNQQCHFSGDLPRLRDDSNFFAINETFSFCKTQFLLSQSFALCDDKSPQFSHLLISKNLVSLAGFLTTWKVLSRQFSRA